MSERPTTLVPAFSNAVRTAFAFLTAEFDFSLQQESDLLFRAETPKCRVRILMDRRQVVVSVGPVDVAKYRVTEVGLFIIARCLAPHEVAETGTIQAPEELMQTCEDLAATLRRHCGPFLRGNFSEWARIEGCADREIEEWHLESLERQEQAVVGRLREQARQAFAARDYREAVRLFREMGERLTTVEREKLKFASERLMDRIGEAGVSD